MDQIKIGKFIQACRKEKGLTQAELADRLSVSFKTVSKWECGWGMPEVSCMISLCNELGITVNELLSGERIPKEQYEKTAEENLAELSQIARQNKRVMIMSALATVAALVGAFALIMVAGLLDVAEWQRWLLIAIGLVIVVVAIVTGCFFDRRTGYFECPNCRERFVPNMGAYVAGVHTLTRRMFKCPHCGKVGMCRKRLSPKGTKKEEK